MIVRERTVKAVHSSISMGIATDTCQRIKYVGGMPYGARTVSHMHVCYIGRLTEAGEGAYGGWPASQLRQLQPQD